MESDQLNEIIRQNPSVDLSALERSRDARERLASVGIKLGGCKLRPALGGSPIELHGAFDQKVRN